MSTLSGATVEMKADPVHTEQQDQRTSVIRVLKVLLAAELQVYTRLRTYHWSVTGVNFYAAHATFESQFYEIADLANAVAERIHQYGAHAPGTTDRFIRRAHLTEEVSPYSDARTMATNLVADHKDIIHRLSKDIENISKESADAEVVTLLTHLLQQHEKMVWMLQI
jgi:starvation-inducible DNA-binding protein